MITSKAKAWAFLRTAIFALEYAAALVDDRELKVSIHRAKEIVEEVMELINQELHGELQLYILSNKVVKRSSAVLDAEESDSRAREIILSVLGG